jgi:uncharacterized protein YeaO (DUF488 family)
MIRIENMYEMSKASDTKRFLIDREWPKKVARPERIKKLAQMKTLLR